jgi:hypothetical protein
MHAANSFSARRFLDLSYVAETSYSEKTADFVMHFMQFMQFIQVQVGATADYADDAD